MKHTVFKLAAAAGLALASVAPAQAATLFTIDMDPASTYVNVDVSQLGWSNVTADIINPPAGPQLVSVGSPWTFDFIQLDVSGVGFGEALVTTKLTFLTPGGSTEGSGTGYYFTAKLNAGGLFWDDTTPVDLGDGTTYKVTFNDIVGLSLDDPKVSATVTLLSEASSAVPEPATWAMLIAGFGLVGGAMRLRRREEDLALAA